MVHDFDALRFNRCNILKKKIYKKAKSVAHAVHHLSSPEKVLVTFVGYPLISDFERQLGGLEIIVSNFYPCWAQVGLGTRLDYSHSIDRKSHKEYVVSITRLIRLVNLCCPFFALSVFFLINI